MYTHDTWQQEAISGCKALRSVELKGHMTRLSWQWMATCDLWIHSAGASMFHTPAQPCILKHAVNRTKNRSEDLPNRASTSVQNTGQRTAGGISSWDPLLLFLLPWQQVFYPPGYHLYCFASKLR